MAVRFISERNLRFLLYEVFDIASLTEFEYFREHNKKSFDMVLKAAQKLAKDLLYPVFTEMDRKTPELDSVPLEWPRLHIMLPSTMQRLDSREEGCLKKIPYIHRCRSSNIRM